MLRSSKVSALASDSSFVFDREKSELEEFELSLELELLEDSSSWDFSSELELDELDSVSELSPSDSRLLLLDSCALYSDSLSWLASLDSELALDSASFDLFRSSVLCSSSL